MFDWCRWSSLWSILFTSISEIFRIQRQFKWTELVVHDDWIYGSNIGFSLWKWGTSHKMVSRHSSSRSAVRILSQQRGSVVAAISDEIKLLRIGSTARWSAASSTQSKQSTLTNNIKNKNTNTQIHRYTDTQIHRYTDTHTIRNEPKKIHTEGQQRWYRYFYPPGTVTRSTQCHHKEKKNSNPRGQL